MWVPLGCNGEEGKAQSQSQAISKYSLPRSKLQFQGRSSCVQQGSPGSHLGTCFVLCCYSTVSRPNERCCKQDLSSLPSFDWRTMRVVILSILLSWGGKQCEVLGMCSQPTAYCAAHHVNTSQLSSTWNHLCSGQPGCHESGCVCGGKYHFSLSG